jgi:acetyltransferase
MEKFFYPDSIAIMGLSSREDNLSRLILGNLIRWGYSGRLFGVNPTSRDRHVNGIKMYKDVKELPEIPDLAVTLLPARFVPGIVKSCGEFGIKRIAVPAGGFNEAGSSGKQLAEELVQHAREYGIRFIGPNGLTIANTANGLCLPFPPLYAPPKGTMSIITQSGGLGLFLWNLMADENIGMAKFASIGNKLDLNEVDFLRYFAQDPETRIICLYVESIRDGRALIEAATECEKPIVLYKANTTAAGSRAAMSHTAAMSNNDDITNAALSRAGIIRIENFLDFISVTKAFSLPPMHGNRIMAMSPAGGFSVILADLCAKAGFEFANPGRPFYEDIAKYGNAGIINLSNPLDMGDMYDPKSTVDIFQSVLHNDNVDGAVFVNQWPRMPMGDDIFTRMFHTDVSQETMGAIRSSGKPLGVCLFGQSKTITRIKGNLSIPIFNTPEEMIHALKIQQTFYARKNNPLTPPSRPAHIDHEGAEQWIQNHRGIVGEEISELLHLYGIKTPPAQTAETVEEALAAAQKIGYPVVVKVVSPDAIHKSEAGGVMVGIESEAELIHSFKTIQNRSEERRVGKECRRLCRSRWSPYH